MATAAFITGHNLGPGRDRIAEACRRGGATMFGTGISPGFAELLAIVAATICDRVDKITVNEAADTTFYDSPATEIPVGFGKPIDHPDLQAMTTHGHGGVRRGRADGRRRARCRARRRAVRGRVRADHRRPRPRIVDHRRGLRRGGRRELEGIGRRQGPRRAQRAVAQGTDARARLEDRPGRLGDPDRRPADGDGSTSASCRRPTSKPRRSPTSWCSATS